MNRGAWWAMVHSVAESDTTEATSRAHMTRAFTNPASVFLSPKMLLPKYTSSEHTDHK